MEEGDIAFFFYAGHVCRSAGPIICFPLTSPRRRLRGAHARRTIGGLGGCRVPVSLIAFASLERGSRWWCSTPAATIRLRFRTVDSIGGERRPLPPPLTNGCFRFIQRGLGQKALDDFGDGDPNSVFTRVLVKQLKVPGVGLREMAFRTQGEVARNSASERGYDQVPGVYSQIIGDDFSLSEPPASPPPVAAPPTSVENLEQTDFAAALRSGSVAKLDLFLSKYPDSASVDIVRRERERLTQALPGMAAIPHTAEQIKPVADDEAAWEKVKVTPTEDALEKFIREFPDSKRRRDAESLLANLKPPRAERPTSQATVSPSVQSKPDPHAAPPVVPLRQPPPGRIAHEKAQPKPTPNGNCFSVNGERYCE